MKAKIESILNHMVRSGGSLGVKSYHEAPDGSFQLVTGLSQYGHKTFLKYEATGDDDMFRVEITHFFGKFDVNVPPNLAAAQLMRMLVHNTESFGTSTAYIGASSQGNTFYATLNSFHHFVTAWSDADIAKALNLHFFDLGMGLVTEDSSLTMLKRFSG